MKQLFALLLACLLLSGCARETVTIETTFPPPETTQATEPVSMYVPGHPLEQQYPDALRAYPLTLRKVTGMRAFGSGLLVFSGYGSTTLTLLTGEELSVTSTLELPFELSAQDPSLRLHEGWLSYYDPVAKETVVLDTSLRAVSHIAAPGDLEGTPILSADRDTLYYCTSKDVRAWDLETGIRRCVKEIFFDSQTISGIHLSDTVLECLIQDGDDTRTMLFSTDTGLLLYEGDGDLSLTTSGSTYYTSLTTGMYFSRIFGEADGKANLLTPADLTADCFYLPAQNAALTVTDNDGIRLDYYDLSTGFRQGVLTLDSFSYPTSVETAEGYVYLLIYVPSEDCHTILRWNVASPDTTVNDGNVYTSRYYTYENPNYKGLVQCQSYAAQLSEKYGIEILVWEDATQVQPWDYDLAMEYQVPVIQQELELLDQRLSQYPDGMLSATASNFTALKLCLVRQLTGTAESGSLATATGVQFLDGTDAYVAIAAGEFSEQALYHELFHVMETHIWNESIAFDQWEALNPDGFTYDYNYLSNAQRDGSQYLSDDSRAFVDAYSMSFPKEDRARIMESAMLPGNESLFQSDIMQLKLQRLCEGIREAYGLEKSPDTYLWEQYLHMSLAYSE